MQIAVLVQPSGDGRVDCVRRSGPVRSTVMNNPKAAIVTGASSGIGMETALALARKGYAVVLAGRREDRLEAVALRCGQLGGRGIVHVTDVTDEGQVAGLVDRAVDELGRLDVMVNNAGFGHFGRVWEIDTADMRAIFDVNFFGLFFGCKAAAPVMMRQRSGHIFNVSSVIGKRGSPFNGAYCATKFAICGLSDSMRVEIAPHNVRVTTVCPALTETEFSSAVRGGQARSKSEYLSRARKMPARKVGQKIASTVGQNRPELVFTVGGKFLAVLAALWPRPADAIMAYYRNDLIRAMDK